MIYVLIICIASCAGMIILTLVKPKISIKGISIGTYWTVIVLGAVLLLAFKLIGFDEVFAGLTLDAAINPLKILAIFISMTVISVFLDETGFFRWLANIVLKKTGSSQIKLFTAFYITVSILTVFTSNDIIILTFTPFICYFAKNAKINPVPYLVSEFVAANTCSMLLVIGNPTNIYLAAANDIIFLDYLRVMALPTLFAVVTAYFIMLALFYKKLKAPLTGTAAEVRIEQKPLLIIGLALLSVCTVLLAVSPYLHIEMWIIACLAAALLILAVLMVSLFKRKKPKELGRALRRAPWELIPFIISMFIMVLALDKYQITDKLALALGEKNTILTYGTVSVLFANLINNIPMSVLFSSVLQNLSVNVSQGVYAVIIGSNIGAFLTPVGALAGIMWLQILKDNKIEFSFLKFMKYGVIIALPTLLAALSGLMIAAAWM